MHITTTRQREAPSSIVIVSRSTTIGVQNFYFEYVTEKLCIIFSFSHTYIHNWPLQPISQDYGLVFPTAHVVCVNFICEWRDLKFNVDSEQ